MTPRRHATQGHAVRVRRLPRNRRGLTLLELLLASAGAALVAAGSLAMLNVAQYGQDDTHDFRKLAAARKAAHARLSASLRECRQVLDAGPSHLVLWRSDLDGDGAPNLLELRRLDYDSVAQTITLYDPDPAATDVSYTPADDFETITDALLGGASMPGKTWVTDVDSFAATLDNATEADAAVVTLTLQITPGELADTIVVESALRTAEDAS
ncbi:MAG: hypothetical protein AAF288_03595 [Planctomycetota bacterium]